MAEYKIHTTPDPKSAANIITVIRNLLKLAILNEVESISISVRYKKEDGTGVYTSFDEIAGNHNGGEFF